MGVTSGLSNADIHVLDQLKANLSGASTLQFSGSPVVDSQVSTASTIRNIAAQTLD